jgi:uncharacterized SAM-binding protein YcdF (DUF218 family)
MINRQNIDGIIVLGRGNHELKGPSKSTHNNAITAAAVAEEVGAKIVITSGYGPDRNDIYPQSEASYMADIITNKTDVPVIAEEASTSTFENFINIRNIIDEQIAFDGLNNWIIIASKPHAKRGLIIGKKVLPRNLSIGTFPTAEKMSPKELAMEKTLGYLSWLATRGVQPGDTEQSLRAQERYNQLISAFKRNKSVSSIHSGRN